MASPLNLRTAFSRIALHQIEEPVSLERYRYGTPGVVWESSNTAKATISDRGVATGCAVGNATITATTAGFINDNAVLTVK